MKLFEAPRNTRLWVPALERVILFHHIDGMYSYCTDEQGNVIHLEAGIEVEVAPEREVDLSWCPNCGGPADRELPPNPYFCSRCMRA